MRPPFKFIYPCVLLLLAGFLLSCHTDQRPASQNNEIHLVIDPAHLPPIARLTDVVQNVRLLPLETNSSCYIGSTHKVFVGKKYILISTEGETNELLLFSADGKFIRKLGDKGKGPGEYADITVMSVYEDSSKVYISGKQQPHIQEYSFDGTISRVLQIPEGLTSPIYLGSGKIAAMSNVDYELVIINTASGAITRYIPVTPEMVTQLRDLDGSLATGYFYWSMGRDTIWQFDRDSMRPGIIGEFGSGHLGAREYIRCISEDRPIPSGKLSFNPVTIKGSGFYHFSLTREGASKQYSQVHLMYQEKTKKSWHLEQSPESDDILFCTSTDFRTVASSGEWVSVVGADELIRALPKIKANKSFRYPPELIGQIEKMTSEDNPVLVLYTFR